MNKALRVEDLQDHRIESSKLSISEKENFTNINADEIRAKIKAARLEKLMARQLESELSIELDTEITLNLNDETSMVIEDDVILDEKVEIQLDIPASKSKGYSAGSSKRMRNIQTTRHSCDEMATRIRSGTDLLSDLSQQTTDLVKQLQFMEQEFANFEEAEVKASKVASDYKRVTNEYEEALSLVEKQNRQLNVLEAQRAKSNSNYEATKLELEKLQRQYQRDADVFSESQMINSELEQDNRSLKSKLNASKTSEKELNTELLSTANSLKQKDMEAARSQAELISTKERLTNSELSLEKTGLELEELSKNFTSQEIKLQGVQSNLAANTDKLEASSKALNAATHEIESLTAEVHEKDMASAKLTSDYASLIKSNSKVSTDLDNIQNKYDELNKSALEQQSQQYARIHELESVLRDTKRKLEAKTKAYAEINVELEATNNLLVLHEEMVSALSPEDRK